MEYWWVNQNQTYQFEVPGGYMWSPKANTNGARNQFYDNMTETKPGDVVFSFKDTYVKAVGIVVGRAETVTKPTEFNSVENQWGQDGWFVPVLFTERERPIRPKNHMEYLRPTLPKKYSPIQVNGNGLQSVYLAKVPPDMASVLTTLLDGQVEEILETGFEEDTLSNAEDDQHESELKGNNDIPETQKSQLIKARRGQGMFRTRVCLIEKKCRITGVSAPQHLRASHIKPWRFSSPNEKLDGNNGLLLSPHIDHLFDHGYISFEANGALLLSPHMKNDILYAWSIDPNVNVGDFLPEQETYLKFHREQMFKK